MSRLSDRRFGGAAGEFAGESPEFPGRVCVISLAPEFDAAAAKLADRLGLALSADSGGEDALLLQLGPEGLSLAAPKASGMGAVRVDFVSGALAHRRQFGGGSAQSIARAVGLQPGVRPAVLDATAGLGRDAFVLASLGCSLTLIERQPVIAALLEDGLRRALADADAAPVAARMKLLEGDAIVLMRGWREAPPQVIYLDPMFPHREKSALVKKEMRLFRPLAGNDEDAPALLDAALSLATHRVVVKRPRNALPVTGAPPGYALEGRSCRFDVYAKKTLKP